jgi:hypothetical protein
MAMFPGFPEVGKKIDMPDIAELLSYPMFRVAEAETVRKLGTDFQRMLLDSVPLVHDTKHVTVYSAVHLLYPGVRPITMGTTKPNVKEWHVDGLEGVETEHLNPTDRAHLLLAHTTFPTVFNASPVEIPNAEYMTYNDFNKYVSTTEMDLDEREAELGVFHTFTNHIHRAQNPTRLEFRFSFRVRETNRPDIPPVEIQMTSENHLFDSNSRKWVSNISRNGNDMTIHYPDIFRP